LSTVRLYNRSGSSPSTHLDSTVANSSLNLLPCSPLRCASFMYTNWPGEGEGGGGQVRVQLRVAARAALVRPAAVLAVPAGGRRTSGASGTSSASDTAPGMGQARGDACARGLAATHARVRTSRVRPPAGFSTSCSSSYCHLRLQVRRLWLPRPLRLPRPGLARRRECWQERPCAWGKACCLRCWRTRGNPSRKPWLEVCCLARVVRCTTIVLPNLGFKAKRPLLKKGGFGTRIDHESWKFGNVRKVPKDVYRSNKLSMC